MESVVTPNGRTTTHTIRSARTARPVAREQVIEKTPEGELMTVEEYFGILRKRVNDYYDGIQGQN